MIDSAGAHSNVAGFDAEMERGVAQWGLKIFSIITVIEPDVSKPCMVTIGLESGPIAF